MKVLLYKESTSTIEKWIYVDYKKAHTHDVRALTVAVPISQEGLFKSSIAFFYIFCESCISDFVCLDELVCKICMFYVWEKIFWSVF